MARKQRIVFCIDDDQQHNEMLENYIRQRYPLEVKTFTSGEEALSKLDELKPSYMILDYYLDNKIHNAKNGLEILKMVKEKYPDIYIIMLSGQEKIEIAVDTMKHGAFDYVVKNPSGFIRVENTMRNINENLKLKYEAKAYKFATRLLSGIIIAIVLTAVVLRILGISTDNVGW